MVITHAQFYSTTLNAGSPQVQILPVACRKFAMKPSEKGPDCKKGLKAFVAQPFRKNNSPLSASK